MAVRDLCANWSWQGGFEDAEKNQDQQHAWLRSDDFMFWNGQGDASQGSEGIAGIDNSSQPDLYPGSQLDAAARCEDFPTSFLAEAGGQSSLAGNDLGWWPDVVPDGSFESTSSRQNDLPFV